MAKQKDDYEKVPMKETANKILHVRVHESSLNVLKAAGADIPAIVRSAIQRAAKQVQ